MDNELVSIIPNGLTTASYQSSLNGERLLYLIFAKIDYLTYMVKEDKRIEISGQEWGNLFHLKNPWRSLQDGANVLREAVFRFQFDQTKEYKLFETFEYDEGVFTFSLNHDFLVAAMRGESGELNPILGLLYETS